MQKFSDRLKLQKFVYLLQAIGLDLGYSFSWYIYGPYSTELTRAGFQIEAFERIQPTTLKNPDQEAILRRHCDFIESNKDDMAWLEIASSLHFLKSIFPHKTKEQIVSEVENKQPYLNGRKQEITRVWDQLGARGLL